MHLQPNIGSDRSWVWKVAADYSETPPTSETLAIRFANSDSKYSFCGELGKQLFNHTIFLLQPDAGQFKGAFEDAQKTNSELAGTVKPTAKAEESAIAEEKPEE